jgi:hypothetical protein
MSQQEFVSPSQSQQSQEEDEFNDDETYSPQHPYYWLPNKAGVPRDEPPSSYDEPMVQRGYQAQGRTTDTKDQASTTRRGTGGKQAQRQQFSPDGDAYERRYRMYPQYNARPNVPPWARSQPQQKNVARLVLLIVLGLMLIGPILHLLAGLLILVIGTVFFALLLAFFIIMIIGILSFIFLGR